MTLGFYDEHEHPHTKVQRLNQHQLELYGKLTALQRDVCMSVLDGLTFQEAYEQSPFAEGFSSMKNSVRAITKNKRVQAFLRSIQDETVDDRIMKREEALRILTRQARGKLDDVLELKSEFVGMCPDGGGPIWRTKFGLKRADEIDPELFANIVEMSHTNNGIKVKQYSQKDAVNQLARMQGLDRPQEIKHTVSGPDGGPVENVSLNKEDYAEIRKQMLEADDC